MKPLFLIASLVSLSATARAAVTFTQTVNVSTFIPDNDDAGITSEITVAAGIGNTPAAADIAFITSVTVDLNFTGGWNGDLYVYLVHGTGFSVLLNRIGRDEENPYGSPLSGMSVTLSDEAAEDVHTATSGNAFLTGIYKPDGRNVDPLLVTAGNPRDALLSTFNGLDAAGGWILFVADQSGGDQSFLQSWSLTITAVPEPSTACLFLGASLPLFRRRRENHRP